MGLIREFYSRLQYKIILPFLALAILVAVAGGFLGFLFVAQQKQEQVNNQLAQQARTAGDAIVTQENRNLQLLYDIAFALPNSATGAPAVSTALAKRDTAGLERALDPFFQISLQRRDARLDRLIVFDTTGAALVDWETTLGVDNKPSLKRNELRDLSALWFTALVLGGQADQFGDKYAGLLNLNDGSSGYLFTVAPVSDNGKVVGGTIVASRIDTIIKGLRENLLTAGVTVYGAQDGTAFASTHAPVQGITALNLDKTLVNRIGGVREATDQSVLNTIQVNGYSFVGAYAPLVIRGTVVGLLSVDLPADYVSTPVFAFRAPLIGMLLLICFSVIVVGILAARRITRPLEDLVATATAVTAGDYSARSTIQVADEIGLLASSFNNMTSHLLTAYDQASAEASQRAAIVQSIADAVVVCDREDQIMLINRTMRQLIGLLDTDPMPACFSDIPLAPLEELALTFGTLRTPDLFTIYDHVVRVVRTHVAAEDGSSLGFVYVLQDLTDQVAIDRAKTNFIGTISHELRTPLTVLGASTELMQRELVGPLTPEQRNLVDSMRRHAMAMTTALNNVIAIAGLESGTQSFIIEPLSLREVFDDLLWSVKPQIKSKGLSLDLQIPPDLPVVMADRQQLRDALYQLLDNARRYTDSGDITVHATQTGGYVRVDISDTGRGVPPEVSESLFTRFTRGPEGINSSERGIGLGLAIVKLVIERLGGLVWLEQTSADGSIFSLTLPCDRAATHHNETALASAA